MSGTVTERHSVLDPLKTQLLALAREPINLALLFVLPVFVIEGFGQAMASYPELPSMTTTPVQSGKIVGTAFSTAFLAGAFSLYQALSAKEADGRLVQAGYSTRTLLVVRATAVLTVDVGIAALSFALLSRSISAVDPAAAFVFLLTGGVVYSLLGVLVGVLSPGLFEGSLVVLLVADIDAFLGSGMVQADASLPIFPLHYPYKLFQSAVVTGEYSVTNGLLALLYIAVLGTLTAVVFERVLST